MEQTRPDVQAQRQEFEKWIKTVDPKRLVFLDESSANTRMARSHAWVRRGEEFVEPRPMNWGKPLTMMGAIRLNGWITLGTLWGSAKRSCFRRWFITRLLPKLRRGDIVVLDNAAIHKCSLVIEAAARKGVTIKYLSPYSPDYNPIEPAWALVKKQIKAAAPRDRASLHRVVHRARRWITADHCKGWFQHCGYRGKVK